MQVFGFADTIPFHLQLRGPMKSLLKLLGIAMIASATKADSSSPSAPSPPPQTIPQTTASGRVAAAIRNPVYLLSTVPQVLSSKKADIQTSLSIRVYLQRRITAKINGQTLVEKRHYGEGILSPVSQSSSDPDATVLDWDGEVRCVEGKAVGSFNTNALQVRVCRLFV